MKIQHTIALAVASVALSASVPALSQTEKETSVHSDTSMKDGVATTKVTTTNTAKRKTAQPKKVLGVKVGHKTAVAKTVKTTKVSSNGDTSTTVKTSH